MLKKKKRKKKDEEKKKESESMVKFLRYLYDAYVLAKNLPFPRFILVKSNILIRNCVYSYIPNVQIYGHLRQLAKKRKTNKKKSDLLNGLRVESFVKKELLF